MTENKNELSNWIEDIVAYRKKATKTEETLEYLEKRRGKKIPRKYLYFRAYDVLKALIWAFIGIFIILAIIFFLGFQNDILEIASERQPL